MHVVDAAIETVEAEGRRIVLLRLVDEDGNRGRGEASPLPGFSPDSAAACATALQRAHLRLGEMPDRLPPVTAVTLGLASLEGDLASVPAAGFALETALFDLIGRRRSLSIAECLGGPRPYRSVPVNGLLVARGDESLVERGRRLVEEGAPALKVKLRARDDAGFALELRTLHALRAALPEGFELRADANGAWDVEEARERMAALAPLGLRFVEQPVAAPRLLELGPCAVPWAADESLLVPGMAERLLGAEGCVAFVLKPALLGGLIRGVTLGARAQARGLDVVVTHLFDGPVALAAAVELALALPRPPLACGLHPHDAPGGWPRETVPQLARVGVASASEAPGLGMEEPAARLRRAHTPPGGP
jgi:o-succinylbenzoate synthase